MASQKTGGGESSKTPPHNGQEHPTNEKFNEGVSDQSESSAVLAETLRSIESTMKGHLDVLVAHKTQLSEAIQESSKVAAVKPSTLNVAPKSAAARRSARLGARPLTGIGKVDGLEPPAPIVRVDKVVIQVRIVFLKVGEIDTMRDRFAADVFLQAKWREPALDNCLEMQRNQDQIDWDKYWSPKLLIENVYGDPKETKWRLLQFDHRGHAIVVEKRRINGAFLEYMELNHFPFDIQDLTVTLTTERDESEVEFVEDKAEPCAVNVESFVDEQEWKLYKYVGVWSKINQESIKTSTKRHPTFSAACKASRRAGFFIWNILVVMFLICSMSFCTFSVKSTLPQNRLQLSFILLLTNVSFKFVVNQSLPMISYLTILDKYILGSMGILCFVCVWHAMIAKMIYECLNSTPPPGNTEAACTTFYGPITTSDNVALGVLSFVYLIFHVIFILIIYKLLKEHSKFANVKGGNTNRALTMDENGMIPDLYNERNMGANFNSNSTNSSVYTASQHNVISAS